ncbi:phosphotransferase family protein [Cellulomonas palmilytica]|uniref:phosphotransferase family protein n=1 Tax=Cellulomonas palmilytica TaxID=2608402 RepID=UPI001F26FD2A|nr:aminoglycoside phosphotransferase family protein [Cellulomonas palmilytica]UJP40211.1 phosphotransferase [Cellulomonas palmilytica]
MTPSGIAASHDPAPQGSERSDDPPAPAGAPAAPHGSLPQPHGLHAAPRTPLRTPGPVPSADVLTLDDPGPVLASGSSADVYALDEDYVLRRYRCGQDATSEARLLQHVSAHGFPVPAVFVAQGPNLLMERLHGPTLLQALAAGEISIADGSQLLVDLHERLHQIPAPQDVPHDETRWPHLSAGPVVAHLDLHPGNVVLSDTHGPSVVDWANARAATPELDVALTALMISEVAVDAGGDYSHAARAFLAAFLARSPVSPVPALDAAAEVRRTDPGLLTGEKELVGDAADLVRELVRVAS